MRSDFEKLCELLEFKWLNLSAQLRPLQKRERQIKQQQEKIEGELSSRLPGKTPELDQKLQPVKSWLLEQKIHFQRAESLARERLLTALTELSGRMEEIMEHKTKLLMEMERERLRQKVTRQLAKKERARVTKSKTRIWDVSCPKKGAF